MAKKQKVILQHIAFRKKNHIAILSMNNPQVDAIVRDIEDAEWSTGYKFWHILCTQENFEILKNKLKNKFRIDASAFKGFNFGELEEVNNTPKRKIKIEKPNPAQAKQIEEFKNYHLEQGISKSTVKVYGSLLNVFWGWHNYLAETQLDENHINQLISDYIDKNNFSSNYKRLMSSTLNRYLHFVEQKEFASTTI